jgi:hypothetical protein
VPKLWSTKFERDVLDAALYGMQDLVLKKWWVTREYTEEGVS